MLQHESIDRALGRLGHPPQPLDIGMPVEERDALLERALWFPDRPLPTGEMANWAAVLIDLGKEPAVLAAVAAVEAAVKLTPPESADVDFVKKVLAELHIWLESPKDTPDLKRLGDLWWSLTRKPPESACTELAYAAVMAWLVAGYDPEGWGDPPDEPHELLEWMSEAADNTTAVVDVFSCIQQAVGSDSESDIVQSVRSALCNWRDTTTA